MDSFFGDKVPPERLKAEGNMTLILEYSDLGGNVFSEIKIGPLKDLFPVEDPMMVQIMP